VSTTDILNDYVTLKQFANDIEKSTRTVARWMDQKDGLPFLKFGRERLVHLPSARRWMLSRVRQRNPSQQQRWHAQEAAATA
jgi:hypothetical protein